MVANVALPVRGCHRAAIVAAAEISGDRAVDVGREGAAARAGRGIDLVRFGRRAGAGRLDRAGSLLPTSRQPSHVSQVLPFDQNQQFLLNIAHWLDRLL
jgi:hypothetical protein